MGPSFRSRFRELGAEDPQPPSSPKHAVLETPDPGKRNGSTWHEGTAPHPDP